MTFTYIFHSCFLVNTPDCRIIFDYWQDPSGLLPDLLEADGDKPLYVVVSHFHKDHYNPEIFRWAEQRNNVRYILSKDTAKRGRHFFSPTSTHRGPHIDPSIVTVIREGDVYRDEYVTIRAFGSTDEGNSYLVETDGRSIFHASDLNAWIWKGESTEKEVEDAIALFRRKIQPIKDLLASRESKGKIDVAMFPVDSRIGEEYWTGAKIFLKELPVGFFLPMHFGLGDEEEQAVRALDAAAYPFYANPDYPTVFVGPLRSFGQLALPSAAATNGKREG